MSGLLVFLFLFPLYNRNVCLNCFFLLLPQNFYCDKTFYIAYGGVPQFGVILTHRTKVKQAH